MRRSTITRAARHDLAMVKGAMTMSADRQSSSSAAGWRKRDLLALDRANAAEQVAAESAFVYSSLGAALVAVC
jgi:hypothetical protein